MAKKKQLNTYFIILAIVAIATIFLLYSLSFPTIDNLEGADDLGGEAITVGKGNQKVNVVFLDDWSQTAKFTSTSVARGGDEFGFSVSISGDYIIVGKPFDDTLGSNAGAVYIFEKPDGEWINMIGTNGLFSTISAGARLGHSVDIDGDFAVVGAPFESQDGFNGAGVIYIFERGSDGDWDLDAEFLSGDDASNGDRFGISVSISENYIIVGAESEDVDGNTNSGAAYIFKNTAGGWIQTVRLESTFLQDNEYFGHSVSIDGDYAIVGAYGYDPYPGCIDGGAAYIFERNSDESWTSLARLSIGMDMGDGGGCEDYFGNAVAIDGDYAVVGSPFNDYYGTNDLGSAYVFKKGSVGWDLEARLIAYNAYPGDRLGVSVAIDGDYVIVGAIDDGEPILLFKKPAGGWEGNVYDMAELSASGMDGDDEFGHSLAIDGNYIVVGERLDDDSGTDAGAAYVFKGSNVGDDCDDDGDCTLGDLNGDCGWNVLDIVTLANCILAGNCLELENACAGDLNGDGGYNVLDIVTLANCVLAGNCGRSANGDPRLDLLQGAYDLQPGMTLEQQREILLDIVNEPQDIDIINDMLR